MKRILEPEIMADSEEANAYDNIVNYEQGKIIDTCFTQSILNMGIAEGKVLDVGAGSGRIAIMLADRCPDLAVTAVDLSDSMLELSENTKKNIGVTNVDFQIGDAKELPFPDNHFDLVYSHVAFHHMDNAGVVKSFKEAQRVVKPEGAILIRDLKRPGNWFSLQFYLNVFGAPYNKLERKLYKESLRAGFNKNEFESLAKQAGITGFSAKQYFFTHIGIEKFAQNYQRPKLKYDLDAPKSAKEKTMRNKLITKPLN